MNKLEMTQAQWVAEALRCYANNDLPTVCSDTIFQALCQEVIDLRLELDGEHEGSVRPPPTTHGDQ